MKKIPFSRPPRAGNELTYIAQAIESEHLSGDGEFTQACHDRLRILTGASKVLLTHSCTAALEMAAILCDLQPGDEVIMPSYTFVSTANAVVLRGAVPVFVDIELETRNIAPELVTAAITGRTKAIFVVHYAGVPCDMAAINAIAAEHGLIVVEDAAQALGSTFNGQKVGSLADLSAFSFHATKNLVSGEGGALAINNPRFAERAEIIREKGTNRSAFLRGDVQKYAWVDIGSSFLPSELTAAFLLAQLEASEELGADRMESWLSYDAMFARYGAQLPWLGRPHIPANVTHNAHIYSILMRDQIDRDGLLQHLKDAGIGATFHYVPLHSSSAGIKYGRVSGSLARTDEVAARLVRLPLFNDMGKQRERVIDATSAYVEMG